MEAWAFNIPAPRGAAESPRRISRTHTARQTPRRGHGAFPGVRTQNLLRPAGAKKGKKEPGLLLLIRFPRVPRRAATRQAVRNPWKRSCFNTSAPKGRRNRRDARRINQTHTAHQTRRRGPGAFAEVRTQNLLRPAGAKKNKRNGLLLLIRFPRVARRAATRSRRSTRGYSPSPRWG